jgi:hypothetical protein
MKNILVGIAVLGACGAAQASEDTSGVIFGAGVGAAHVETNREIGFDGTSNGWKGFAGWRFNEYVAVEGAFIDVDSIEHTYGNGVREALDGEIIQASIVGTWPANEYVSLYARASNNWWDSAVAADFNGVLLATGEDSGNDLGWGAGIGAVWDRALFRLEYEAMSTDDVDFSLVSLSIAWRL